MPLVGLLDDAFIIGLCIKCFSTDLEQYKIWKYGESEEVDEGKESDNKNYDEVDYEIVDDREEDE